VTEPRRPTGEPASHPGPRLTYHGPGRDRTASIPFAEHLSPQLLKSPWWIGTSPSLRTGCTAAPRTIVNWAPTAGRRSRRSVRRLRRAASTPSATGSICGSDVHMGRLEKTLRSFCLHGLDLPDHCHIAAQGLQRGRCPVCRRVRGPAPHRRHAHARAVSNDFRTWLPKMSAAGVVLFHDINVTIANTGRRRGSSASARLRPREAPYPHFEFSHCWASACCRGHARAAAGHGTRRAGARPGVLDFFASKGALVSRRFEAMGVSLPSHRAYSSTTLPGAARSARCAGWGAAAPAVIRYECTASGRPLHGVPPEGFRRLAERSTFSAARGAPSRRAQDVPPPGPATRYAPRGLAHLLRCPRNTVFTGSTFPLMNARLASWRFASPSSTDPSGGGSSVSMPSVPWPASVEPIADGPHVCV